MCHIRLFFAPRCVNRDVPPLRVVSCREGFLPCLACACVEVDPKKPSIQQQFGRCFYSVFVVQNWGWHGWSPSKSTGKWSWGSKQNDQWPMAARPAWWLLYWLLYFWIWFKYQYHRVSVDGMSAVCWHMFTNVLQSVYKYIYIIQIDTWMHIFLADAHQLYVVPRCYGSVGVFSCGSYGTLVALALEGLGLGAAQRS